MSAYICNPEHFAALAAFASHVAMGHPVHGGPIGHNAIIYEWRYGCDVKSTVTCALGLMAENVRSVAARYPDCDALPGPILSHDELVDEVSDLARRYARTRPSLTPVDILSMCKCYEYQSCETEGFRDSLAYRQIQWIISKAIDLLPGADLAIRDFSDKSASWRHAA